MGTTEGETVVLYNIRYGRVGTMFTNKGSEKTGDHWPFSVHCSAMTGQKLICEDVMTAH